MNQRPNARQHPTRWHATHSMPHSRARGFTLVELMVALTGGLFVSLAVFALARDSGRFYQRESRIANATVGTLLGFERLRTDIARAGFLSSPNSARDLTVCVKPDASWPSALRSLASVQITAPPGGVNARNPSILLAGSFSSSDIFPARVVNNSTSVDFFLIPNTTALYRLGNGANPDTPTMQTVFMNGRALRFVQYGKQYYGQIVDAQGGPAPRVRVNTAPPIPFRTGALGSCGANIIGSGAGEGTVNVVNFIQYSLRNLSTSAQTAQGQTDYASLYASSAAAPGEAQRTELVRVEENVSGIPINGTEEVVAEYAVDLAFQVTAVSGTTGCCDPQLAVYAPTVSAFAKFTGDVFGTSNQPELIRSLRVRLGARSREGDRAADLTGDVDAGAGQGLYRVNVGSGPEPFARVRTFQADVALNNQMDILW